jgi:hypothetical protein
LDESPPLAVSPDPPFAFETPNQLAVAPDPSLAFDLPNQLQVDYELPSITHLSPQRFPDIPDDGRKVLIFDLDNTLVDAHPIEKFINSNDVLGTPQNIITLHNGRHFGFNLYVRLHFLNIADFLIKDDRAFLNCWSGAIAIST